MVSTRPALYPLPLAGWKEFVIFPRLGLGPLVAKLDTGARSAALHADEITVSGQRVRFVIGGNAYRAALAGRKVIKSSNGISELRPVIHATIQLGASLFKTEVTLTRRSDMGVPLLLGRAAIKGRYLVNPARTFLLSRKGKASR
jgi:hypothetical protein